MARCIAEIDANLPILKPDESAYSVTSAEMSLPYLRNCIKENFRITPVFTMPLARRLLVPEGLTIAGNYIPYGVSHLSKLSIYTKRIFNSIFYLDIHRCLQPCIPSQSCSLGLRP